MAKLTFTNNSKQVIAALKGASEKGITTACLLVESQAKALTPVDTGKLRDSITHKVKNEGGDVVGEVGTPIEYGEHVEYGTKHQKAQAFLIPSFRSNKSNIIRILTNDIKSGVGK